MAHNVSKTVPPYIQQFVYKKKCCTKRSTYMFVAQCLIQTIEKITQSQNKSIILPKVILKMNNA